MKKLLVCAIMALGIVSCSASGEKQDGTVATDSIATGEVDTIMITDAIATETAQTEDFEAFYAKFLKDLAFQAERCILSLAVSNDDNDYTINDTKELKEWGTMVPTIEFPRADKVTKSVKDDKAHVEYQNPQLPYTEIILDFVLQDGK